MYNSMLSFTSMGARIDRSVTHGRGPYTFRISGEICHRIGSLLPELGMQLKYAQLYIYGTEHEVLNRLSVVGGEDSNSIDAFTLEGLQSMLNSIKPYTKLSRNARGFSKIQPKTFI